MDLSGFKKQAIPEKTLAELQSHFSSVDLRFGTPRVRTHDLGCDVLVNVQWYEHDKDGPGHEVRHTVVFLHRPRTTLPEFEIRPRKGLGNKMLGMLVSMLGAPPLEIEDEPEFSERYTVMTANPDSVRILLGREVIDSLVAVEDLFLKFSGRGVLASRHSVDGSSGSSDTLTMRRVHDHRLDRDETRSLLEEALVAGGAIADDPELGRHAADAVEGSYAEEAVRSLTEQGGFIGRQIAKTLITSDMLDGIRTGRTPRSDVPPQLARRAWGGTRIPLIAAPVFGLVFAGIGIFSLIGGSTEGLIFLGVGLVAILITGLVFRHRTIRRRLIIDGVMVEGHLTGVERTNTSVNDDPIHAVTIQTGDGGDPMIVKMGSGPAQQARRMMESGRRTWILRDPKKPSRGLWIEGWSFEASID